MSESNAIVSSAKYALKNVRSTVPALSFLDDTGFILLGYLAAWIVIYLIGLVLKDSKAPDALDRRCLFDARTKLKEQELEIAKLRKNMPNLADQEQFQRNYQDIQQKLQDEQRLTSSLRAKIIDPKVIEEKDKMIATLQNQKQNEIAQLKQEKDLGLSQLRTEIETLHADVQNKQKTINELANENEELKDAVQMHKENAEDLQQKYDGVLVMLSENKSRHVEESAESDGSAASGGWSNVGNDLDLDAEVASDKKDDDETIEGGKPQTSKTKQPKNDAWTADELKELAKAKADLRKLEAERDQLSLKLQAGQSEKGVYEERISSLNKEVETLRTELKEKKTHADKREEEASGQREQLNKLLEMINEKDQKIGRAEAEQGQLKDTVRHLETEVHKFEIMKQQSDQKIKELEDRIDKADELKSKLQSRWYHDERNYTAKIRTLEENITKLESSLKTVNASFDPPNAASPMSERDYPGGVDDVPDLWSPYNANNSSRRERHLATGSLINYRYKPKY